jgi:acetyltransferase-like isoleucine patch superfamily enzyme
MSIPHPLSALGISLDDVLFNFVINLLPDDIVSNSLLRPALARLFGLRCGRGSQIRDRIFYEEHRKLVIGSNVLLNRMAYLDAGGGIAIGDNVRFGPHVMMVTGTHEIGDPSMRTGELISRPIVIGDGCWIGARVFIGPGVTIGAGSIVSAGSVVQRSMPANFMIAGNPARPVSPLEGAERSPGNAGAPSPALKDPA